MNYWHDFYFYTVGCTHPVKPGVYIPRTIFQPTVLLAGVLILALSACQKTTLAPALPLASPTGIPTSPSITPSSTPGLTPSPTPPPTQMVTSSPAATPTAAATASATTVPAPRLVPDFSHVIIFMLENHEFDTIIDAPYMGSPAMPDFNA